MMVCVSSVLSWDTARPTLQGNEIFALRLKGGKLRVQQGRRHEVPAQFYARLQPVQQLLPGRLQQHLIQGTHPFTIKHQISVKWSPTSVRACSRFVDFGLDGCRSPWQRAQTHCSHKFTH